MPESAAADRREHFFRRGLRLEYFSVAWDLIEGGVALAAGIVSGSTALIAFGADSAIEVISALALVRRFREAGPEATEEEHDAAERRALGIVGVTFFLLAAYVAFESVRGLVHHEAPERSPVGLALALVSLVVMPVLARAKQTTGRALGSKALQADGAETWVCAYLSLALVLGIGVHMLFGWWWADDAAALAMLPVLLWQGWETLEEAREEED